MSRRRIDPDEKIALPITPMLDMTFQLLFFFIMNFNPVDAEGQMALALPVQERDPVRVPAGGVGGPPIAAGFPTELIVVLRTQNEAFGEGGISALFVRDLSGVSKPINGLDGLEAYLTKERANLTDKEAIKIRADSRLHIKHVLKVIDVCKAAGFSNPSLLPPEDNGR